MTSWARSWASRDGPSGSVGRERHELPLHGGAVGGLVDAHRGTGHPLPRGLEQRKTFVDSDEAVGPERPSGISGRSSAWLAIRSDVPTVTRPRQNLRGDDGCQSCASTRPASRNALANIARALTLGSGRAS